MMTIRKVAIVTLGLFATLASGAQAEVPSGDQIAAGRKFAQLVCGACHVVTQNRDEVPILRPPAPSFAALAQRPSLTEQSLRELLGSNHRGLGPAEAMPNPRLADYQIDEIVAYILALKAAN
jgi:mono/diheme cytochrome c family protein